MRIGLVIEHADPWRGGAETSAAQYIDHLVARGMHVELFTRSEVRGRPGCTVRTIAAPGLTRLGQTRAWLAGADRAVRASVVDLVHAISPLAAADIYEPRGGTLAETMARNIALRSSPARRWLKRNLTRLTLRQQVLLAEERSLLRRDPPPLVAAVSQYVARQLHEHESFPGDHIRVVFNGVDPIESTVAERSAARADIRRAQALGEDTCVVLAVAHNFRLKGVPEAIGAVAAVRTTAGRDVVLLVIGRDNPRRCRRLARRLGIEPHVRFLGAVGDVHRYYLAADVLLHPTYYDPCSRVVLEALCAGLPCITTRFNGAAEVIEDGVHGYVVESPADLSALAGRLALLTDPAQRAAIGEAASSLRHRLTMSAHADQMIALYHELLDGR